MFCKLAWVSSASCALSCTPRRADAMALALVVLAQCFMAPPLAARCGAMVQQNQQLRQRLPSCAEMKDKGDYIVLFGKYADEKTWDELLTDDPPYCEWVLGLGRQRLQSLPGAPELQKWLREQKMQPAKKTSTQKPKKSGAKNKRSELKWLYHYTSTERAKQILSSHSLNPSIRAVSGDAREGDGIYFTSLKQNTPYSVLHENNYDGARRMRAQNAYVRVRRKKIPDVLRASTSPDRDVWVLPTTKPLDLDEVGAELSWKKQPWGDSRHGDKLVYVFGRP